MEHHNFYLDDQISEALLYPRSLVSYENQAEVIRSLTWNQDIAKDWNTPITGIETMHERAQSYIKFFKLTQEQLKSIFDNFLKEMKHVLELRKNSTNEFWERSKYSLKMTDTHLKVDDYSDKNIKGNYYVLEFATGNICKASAKKVELLGNGKYKYTEKQCDLKEKIPGSTLGLFSPKATGLMLFDSLASLVGDLIKDEDFSEPAPIGFVVGLPLQHRSISRASLTHWIKTIATGRKTLDSVEGLDFDALLNCAFWRNRVQAKVVAVVNDTACALLACRYQNPANLPLCSVAFIIDDGVNGTFVLPDASARYSYKGDIINCELGNFNKSLPIIDVDIEVDCADAYTEKLHIFEKMISAIYLKEICRRVIVKTWQNEAPLLAWVRNSLDWLQCVRIVEDKSEDLTITKEVFYGLWEWETSFEQRKLLQELCKAVFERSAALAAVAIAALATQTEKLQPALNGVTCAIEGHLYTNSPFYRKSVSNSLKLILPGGMHEWIHLITTNSPMACGASVILNNLEKK